MFSLKGAPEVVLASSMDASRTAVPVPLDASRRDHFLKLNDEMAKNGMRVLGLAFKEISGDPNVMSPRDIEGGLTWLGLAGMMDPPRPEVKESVEKCKARASEWS